MTDSNQNPYNTPQSPLDPNRDSSSRTPSPHDWLIAIVISVAAAAIAFFATCFGTFWVLAAVAEVVDFYADYYNGMLINLYIAVVTGIVCAVIFGRWYYKKFWLSRRKHDSPQDSKG